MKEIFQNWTLGDEHEALAVLREYSMSNRNNLAAEAQKFADWLALQNSRDSNK